MRYLAVSIILLFNVSAIANVLQIAPDQPKIAGEAAVTAEGSKPGVISESAELAVYIVRLANDPVASYRGGIANFVATSPKANRSGRFNANSPASMAYAEHLESLQNTLVDTSEFSFGRKVSVPFTYQHAFNGLAMKLSANEAAMVARMPNVVDIRRERIEVPLTDDGPQLIGAPAIWDGTLGFTASQGEGATIAVLDTGINHDHPSFADIGGDGYDHTNPLGSGIYIPGSHCDIVPSFCNDKLIGAWDFVNDAADPGSPEDNDGHGSHTASTAAGNVIPGATLIAPTTSLTRDISGVAPHANIIMYDVCVDRCAESALLGAVNQVLIDSSALPGGINSINYSISGGNDPYNSNVELAFLNLTDAGIYVAASAGNSGPGAETTGHNSPWVSTTGASTHRRSLPASVTGLASNGAPLNDLNGTSLTAGYGPASIVFAGDFPTSNGSSNDTEPEQCLEPFPSGHFSGEIVVCDRGGIDRVEKGINVLAGGAGGLVLANLDRHGESIAADAHDLPAVHIGATAGDQLRAWLAAESNTMASLSGYTVDVSQNSADIMGGFSSRGPNSSIDIIKPDVTAPGVSVFAAGHSDTGIPTPEFQLLSGTSMSSPHHAGAAALISLLNPTWTPAEIKSAFMMTSRKSKYLFKEDGSTPADPFDAGAGRIDLNRAPNAGLVLDESKANFDAANPDSGGDPKTLNIASMANGTCLETCSWTRTVTNISGGPDTWQTSVANSNGVIFDVSPSQLNLAAGASAGFTVTANTHGIPDYTFSELVLTPLSGGETLHMPIALQRQGSTNPELLTKTVNMTEADEGDILDYQISVVNNRMVGPIVIEDEIPAGMSYVAASASSAITNGIETTPPIVSGNTLSWEGELDRQRPTVIVGSPPWGYVSLALYFAPISPPSDPDEGGYFYDVNPFFYNGDSYSRVIWSVNGTIEVGAASGVATVFTPDQLPNSTVPDNLLAPFWADLDLTSAGNWYAGVLTDGVSDFVIFEWENVPEWDNPASAHTFQVWIEAGTDNIWYTYAGISSTSIPLTVGAENYDGTLGHSYFYNSDGTSPVGTPPAVGTDLQVVSTPAGTLDITFQAALDSCQVGTSGKVNHAYLTASGFSETAIAVTICDDDGDGVHNDADNCPGDYNPGQEDFDGDGAGYACDITCASSMDIVHDFNSSDTFDLQASGSIMYQGDIATGANIIFDAASGVSLKNGTRVNTGALLSIMTTGCTP